MFELLWVFYCWAREDLGGPIHVDFALLLVLRQTRVRPFFFFYSFLMFSSASVNGAFGFADVDRCGLAWTVEFVDTLTFAGRGATFVFSA